MRTIQREKPLDVDGRVAQHSYHVGVRPAAARERTQHVQLGPIKPKAPVPDLWRLYNYLTCATAHADNAPVEDHPIRPSAKAAE